MSSAVVAPIQMSVTVPLPPERAFELFATRIGEWWPLREGHSLTVERAAGCWIEPFAGGRVFERSIDGEEHDWGQVLVYEPPRRLAMTWHPGGGPATEVEVRFTPADDGTFVELEHRGWEVFGDEAEAARSGYANGWPYVFTERFAAAARS
jgi:uncharacterized protein YndB with AHSA1/START domain